MAKAVQLDGVRGDAWGKEGRELHAAERPCPYMPGRCILAAPDASLTPAPAATPAPPS